MVDEKSKITEKVDKPNCHLCSKLHNGLFCDLQPSSLEDLTNSKSLRHYKKGQTIYREFSYPRGLYCVYSGKVKIHKSAPNGKERILNFASPGDVIGYSSSLSTSIYSESATALQDSIICSIPREVLIRVMKNAPSLYISTIKMLAKELDHANQNILMTGQKKAQGRVAYALLTLYDSFGTIPNSNELNVVLTKREIGEMVGITTEATIRVMSRFLKLNIISMEGKRIIFNDLSALENISDLN